MGLLRKPGETVTREDRARIVFAPGRYDASAFERLEPGRRKDEFLELVPEAGQTAEEFASEAKERWPAHRRAIRFYPYTDGESAPTGALLGALTRFVEAAFPGAGGEIGPARPIPEEFFDEERERAEADAILEDLLDYVSVDALAVIALASAALSSGPRDTVGGLASFKRRVAVLSLPFHAEGADDALFLRRTLGAVAHDVGHVLGMAHCVFFRCAMNGAATDEAVDERPMHFCPVCEEKISIALPHARGVAAESRKRLRELYREYGLVPEARFVEKRLKSG